MASDKDLIEKIEALAKELGRDDVTTEDSTNKQLVALLKVLQGAANAKTFADAEPEAEAEKPEGPTVVKGKSICATKHRILGSGDPVTADDLAGGKKAFADLVKSGHILKP